MYGLIAPLGTVYTGTDTEIVIGYWILWPPFSYVLLTQRGWDDHDWIVHLAFIYVWSSLCCLCYKKAVGQALLADSTPCHSQKQRGGSICDLMKGDAIRAREPVLDHPVMGLLYLSYANIADYIINTKSTDWMAGYEFLFKSYKKKKRRKKEKEEREEGKKERRMK